MMFRIFTPPHHIKAALRHLKHREDGVAAVEFALVLPVLLLILMGVIELSNVLMVERKLLNSMQSVADLIGQSTDVTDSDLDDIFIAGQLVMNPYSTSGLSIGVASVRFDDTTGNPTLDWSDGLNGGSVANALTLAVGRGEAGASIVIVSGSYTYTPLSSLIIPTTTMSLTETSYVRPRTVDYIIKN